MSGFEIMHTKRKIVVSTYVPKNIDVVQWDLKMCLITFLIPSVTISLVLHVVEKSKYKYFYSNVIQQTADSVV